MSPRRLSLIAAVCAVAIAAGAAVQLRRSPWVVRAEDSNGDGRPDLWHVFDSRGQLVEVDLDTNGDGRADVQEFYRSGLLVRRVSDRNFNGQVDFIEEFDPGSHERVRTLTDVDNDGVADVLVLFTHGRPTFSKRVASFGRHLTVPRAAAAGYGRLDGLTDPFQSDPAIRGGIVSNAHHTPFEKARQVSAAPTYFPAATRSAGAPVARRDGRLGRPTEPVSSRRLPTR